MSVPVCSRAGSSGRGESWCRRSGRTSSWERRATMSDGILPRRIHASHTTRRSVGRAPFGPQRIRTPSSARPRRSPLQLMRGRTVIAGSSRAQGSGTSFPRTPRGVGRARSPTISPSMATMCFRARETMAGWKAGMRAVRGAASSGISRPTTDRFPSVMHSQ